MPGLVCSRSQSRALYPWFKNIPKLNSKRRTIRLVLLEPFFKHEFRSHHSWTANCLQSGWYFGWIQRIYLMLSPRFEPMTFGIWTLPYTAEPLELVKCAFLTVHSTTWSKTCLTELRKSNAEGKRTSGIEHCALLRKPWSVYRKSKPEIRPF